MAYTETTTTGYFQRLGSSFSGMGLGIVLFIVGSGLLWWNEGNFVATRNALNEAQGLSMELASVDQVDPAADGKLVHAVGNAVTQDLLIDSIFGVSVQGMQLKRKVEFYQWTERASTQKRQKLGGGEETVTTYTYEQAWQAEPVNSQNFKDPQARTAHVNTTALTVQNETFKATNVTFGAYRLPDFLISSISGAQPLNVQLTQEQKNGLNQQIRNQHAAAARQQGGGMWSAAQGGYGYGATDMVHEQGNVVYVGAAPNAPQIGDVRVTFTYVQPAKQISVLAQVNGNTFQPFKSKNGKTVSGLSMGVKSMDEMYEAKHTSNSMLTWVLRVAGAGLVIAGLKVLFAPLSVLASVVPILGRIVGAGAGLVSSLLGGAWSLLVLSLAWLRFRPMIGGIMLAIAVVLVSLLMLRGKGKGAVPPPAPPAQPAA